MSEQMPHNERFQLDRLAFFSDAVFAIAITLLVIEIKVPHVESDADLRVALANLLPQYIGFVVSFFVIGRFWSGHHRLFGLLTRSDDGLVGRNLGLLLLIAFGPFPTAVISDYAGSRTAVCVYAGWLALAGVANLRLVRYATATHMLHATKAGGAVMTRLRYGAWSPILIAALALGLGMIRAPLAMIPLLLSPLILAGVRHVVDRSQSRRSASETETTT